MITEDYCSYEVAKLLKEKGFNEPCYRWYDTKGDVCAKFINPDIPLDYSSREYYLCPSQSMAMAWLREVYNLYICPKYCCFCGPRQKDIPYFKWEARILKLPSSNIIYPHPLDMCKHYDSYEEAVEAALFYTLKNLI